ncbi:PREDICTED: uncharacterized protein LOC106745113 [Dinoponera quadriceps]|uniref:Regulatory protein zeste n=1 Tax=Dinoponera quadriceps TaxID=609295 RepID=A0A6P3XC96_DINQU|nr:PREDICTED: uncharacterized protein LOC106745113 [Dinoponera quadriceps]
MEGENARSCRGSVSSETTTTVLLKKRERTQNWVPEEKNALFALIKLHVSAIENKKIDQAASTRKALAWQQIYSAFRGRFTADRDIVRIKEQWRRMKAQARIEMYTYAEKVRTLGPDVATKSRPSGLSVEVWRLMESVRRNDRDAERSDDSSSQETHENRTTSRVSAIHAILDNLTLPATLETSVAGHEVKIEINSDTYNTEDENSHSESAPKSSPGVSPRKRPRTTTSGTEDEHIECLEPKIVHPNSGLTSRVNDEAEYNAKNESLVDKSDVGRQRAMWICKSTQREHEIKLRMLQIELERAELQKQTAVNELKTSEIKRQLIESQAAEYFRSLHQYSIHAR